MESALFRTSKLLSALAKDGFTIVQVAYVPKACRVHSSDFINRPDMVFAYRAEGGKDLPESPHKIFARAVGRAAGIHFASGDHEWFTAQAQHDLLQGKYLFRGAEGEWSDWKFDLS